MTRSAPLAVVSPRDNRFGLLTEDAERVLPPALSETHTDEISIRDYLSRFPDSFITEFTRSDSAQERLSASRDHSMALDFVLLLFDSELSDSIRKEIATELDDLLRCETNRRYVLDLLLASPLPNVADGTGALRAASGCRVTTAFLTDVLDRQDHVRFAHSSWLESRSNSLVLARGPENVRGQLIARGVFRRLVLEGSTKSDIDRVRPSIIMEPGLAAHCDPRIVAGLIATYASYLPDGAMKQPVTRTVASAHDGFDDERTDKSQIVRSVRSVKADVKRDQAEKQVERISELFRNGNDPQARSFLDQLIASQTAITTDHRHVVKSLCNVASRCIVYGRRDISIECLSTALRFESGVDAILYLQIGQLLRGVDDFLGALAVYQKAIDLDSGFLRDSIKHEIIRVHVAQGDYERALIEYHELKDIEFQPQVLAGLGTLYRKMGFLRDATRYYLQALDVNAACHYATAGLAEVAKQFGDHHKAIRIYNRILSNAPDVYLDQGAAKVYELAKSSLLRLTGQLTSAQRVLKRLIGRYPRDGEIHLQLAKVFALGGDYERAQQHRAMAQQPSIKGIAAALFNLAMNTGAEVEGRPSANDILCLPEERGLAACQRAVRSLRQGDYAAVSEILTSTKYVDRLHADFSAVLRYHASARMSARSSYKYDRDLCRIAKRGFRELRRAMMAIHAGDFANAEASESRMCLLVA